MTQFNHVHRCVSIGTQISLTARLDPLDADTSTGFSVSSVCAGRSSHEPLNCATKAHKQPPAGVKLEVESLARALSTQRQHGHREATECKESMLDMHPCPIPQKGRGGLRVSSGTMRVVEYALFENPCQHLSLWFDSRALHSVAFKGSSDACGRGGLCEAIKRTALPLPAQSSMRNFSELRDKETRLKATFVIQGKDCVLLNESWDRLSLREHEQDYPITV